MYEISLLVVSSIELLSCLGIGSIEVLLQQFPKVYFVSGTGQPNLEQFRKRGRIKN